MINCKYFTLLPFLIFISIQSTLFGDKYPTYTVGVEGIPYMPFSEIKNGEYRGLFKNLLEKFGRDEKINFKFIPLPIMRLYSDFYNSKIDFKIPANPYWQENIKKKRKLKITYSRSILNYIDGILVRKENLGKKQLKNLGTVSGFTPWEFLADIKSGKIKKSENPNLISLLKQGLMKRVDGAYINISVGKYYLKKDLKKEGELVFDKNLPYTKSSYMLASIKYPDIIKKFNSYLEKNINDLKKIQKQIDEN